MSPHRAARLAADWHAHQAWTRAQHARIARRAEVRGTTAEHRTAERLFRRWLESDLVNRVLATGVGDQP